jgi:Ca2+-binding RTX toxin-like protein
MHQVPTGRVLAAAAAIALLAALGPGAVKAAAATTAQVRQGTLVVTGDGASDKVSLGLLFDDPNVLAIDVGEDGTTDFAFDRSTFTAIRVNAGGDDDEVRIDQNSGPITGQPITINGGAGNDTLIGGSSDELLQGGPGDDFIDGNIGSDTIEMGGGNDTFNWDPGDGSDIVEGGGGSDTLQFNASNANEQIAFGANGSRVRMTRDVGAITMDLNGIETANLNTLGGTDTVTVGDLTGTDLRAVNVNLAAFGGTGDGAADTVVVDGTAGADNVKLSNDGGGLVVGGLAAQTRVTGDEVGLDAVDVNTLAGDDTLAYPLGVTGQAAVNYDGGDDQDALTFTGTPGDDVMGIARNGTAVAVFSTAGIVVNSAPTVENVSVLGLAGNDQLIGQNGLAGITSLTLDGGSGNDTLRGGDGNDLLLGGPGNDLVDGGIGFDTDLMGTGSDTFEWDPGDGSDVVEGQGGHDTIQFNGSNVGEKIDLSANGSRLRLFRDVANVTTDANGIEAVNFRFLGGADTLTVNDLTGTDVKDVGVDLAGFDGNGDGSADSVIVDGTAGPDRVHVSSFGGQVSVDGLPTHVQIAGSEVANDSLFLNTLDGADSVIVDPGVFGVINPVVDLGAGQ